MAFFFLTIYTILLLIRPQEWAILGIENLPIVQFTLLGCLAAYPFVEHKNLGAPQVPLMILFTIIIVGSVIVGIGWIGGAISLGLEFIQQSFIPFLLICGIVDTLRKQRVLFLVIVFSAAFMALNGLAQASNESGLGIVGNPILLAEGVQRITYLGILSDPNDLGMFLVMSIPIVFLLKRNTSTFFKPIYWAILITILYGIYLTNSRGTLLAVMAIFGFWFWRKYGSMKAIFTAIALSPFLLFVLSRFRQIDVEEAGAQGRLDAWYAGYQMFRSNPVTGVGHRQFTEHHVETAHNSFVLVFSELGLVGSIVWIAILFSTAYVLYQISEKKFIPEDFNASAKQTHIAEQESLIAKTLLYSFLAFAVSGFFLSRSYIPILYIYIGMSAATSGRIILNFSKDSLIINYGSILKYSFYVTVVGIIGTYSLVRIGL